MNKNIEKAKRAIIDKRIAKIRQILIKEGGYLWSTANELARQLYNAGVRYVKKI